MSNKASERRVVYQGRKDRGLCPRCGIKVGKRSRYIYCEDCREFFRNYNQEISEKLNKTRKAQYNRRKAKKQCPRCGKPLGKRYGKTICAKCLEKQYMYNYGKPRPK